MLNLIFETIRDDNIELCRELCDELMSFQKSKATISPEAFDGMNFDTRMKKSYEGALRKHVVVVKDGAEPVAYVFSAIDEESEASRNYFPDWAPGGENYMGFYPEWVRLPQKIGCLNNLYIRDKYRGLGIGAKLCDMSMEWLNSFSDCDLSFVYISNGNDEAYNFYIRKGFKYSHEVFGGFIKAAYMSKK